MKNEEQIKARLQEWLGKLDVDGKPDSYYKFYEGRVAALEWALKGDEEGAKSQVEMENPGETAEEYERGLREKERWLKGKGGEKA
jgi:hypothetical protein